MSRSGKKIVAVSSPPHPQNNPLASHSHLLTEGTKIALKNEFSILHTKCVIQSKNDICYLVHIGGTLSIYWKNTQLFL